MTLEGYVRLQAGVISRAQALEAGLSRDQIDRRLASGVWLPLHKAVYLVAGFRRSDEARLRAASLWAGPDAVVHGASAAWWHGMLTQLPDTITLTVPPRYRRRSPPPGIVVRRRTLPGTDVAVRLDVPIVTGPLAALEAAVELGAGGAVFLDRALQRHVRFPALYRAYSRNLGARGWKDATKLLVAAGWTVLRFTWHDLTGRPAEVVAEIEAELKRPAERRRSA